ncbi:hypothetical protein [Streptomyces sp. NBC_00271]|uniref:hypothetical protein n=1 Tax=Streptomyces sp. NBC_00271 TaxID=2975697 RepID=UPI002E2AAAD3|nr:hypothetical protein [Streptomyces sp. NBC_00271]
MTGEAAFILAYLVVLFGVSALLFLYGRQPTSAWRSRLFTGHLRTLPEPPAPTNEADWPHSEAHRFHHSVSAFVSLVAIVLGLVEVVRNHRPLEAAALAGAILSHVALAATLLRGIFSRVEPSTGEDAPF